MYIAKTQPPHPKESKQKSPRPPPPKKMPPKYFIKVETYKILGKLEKIIKGVPYEWQKGRIKLRGYKKLVILSGYVYSCYAYKSRRSVKYTAVTRIFFTNHALLIYFALSHCAT